MRNGIGDFVRRNPTIVLGMALLAFAGVVAIAAPLITGDPLAISTGDRLRAPDAEHWFGTDTLGRDVFARTVYGARISLAVGLSVAALSVTIGLMIGLIAGYYRWIDAFIMRFMDAMMAIPSILLAIALVAVTKGGLAIVIIAITIPEIPRVVRLTRSVVLSTRELAFVEAAIASGSRDFKIIRRHLLPSTIASLVVLATYVIAAAMLSEAALSFLGVGVPPEIPTWGNMISEHRLYLARAPWTIFFPGAFLTIVVLAVNLLGDGLRDRLDPRLARRM
ncbi:peptide/nickel transport system permease protein [Bradyrhizobium sp. CIR48]|uniref:ABC transporter permease n=1 Tax=Bradyrhizobium sp. CIR48 TaxID=2663840 RepID=UPI00179072A4|nr:ABC transporter permease [Bradyrhizobium sp. CIR48]MBB4423868.1 peptide/nickel transport system permease protein [Bradyrhizobium sp. CIR48]